MFDIVLVLFGVIVIAGAIGKAKIRFLQVLFFLEVLFKNLICKYIKYTEFQMIFVKKNDKHKNFNGKIWGSYY